MVRQSGIGDIEFFLYLADDEPIGMSGQEELHDAEPGLGAHGGEHVGVFGYLFGCSLCGDAHHISMFAEIWIAVKSEGTDFLICPVASDYWLVVSFRVELPVLSSQFSVLGC